MRITAADSGPVKSFLTTAHIAPDIGPHAAGDHVMQQSVPAHHWQAEATLPGAQDDALVSCVVSPGFTIPDLTLTAPDWKPGKPQQLCA